MLRLQALQHHVVPNGTGGSANTAVQHVPPDDPYPDPGGYRGKPLPFSRSQEAHEAGRGALRELNDLDPVLSPEDHDHFLRKLPISFITYSCAL